MWPHERSTAVWNLASSSLSNENTKAMAGFLLGTNQATPCDYVSWMYISLISPLITMCSVGLLKNTTPLCSKKRKTVRTISHLCGCTLVPDSVQKVECVLL